MNFDAIIIIDLYSKYPSGNRRLDRKNMIWYRYRESADDVNATTCANRPMNQLPCQKFNSILYAEVIALRRRWARCLEFKC
jgi:hypothetical protein